MFGARTSPTLAKVAEADTTQEVAEVTPTPVISPIVASAKSQISVTQTPSGEIVESSPKVDAKISTRAVSTVGLSFLAFAFMMDLLIVERKKIPRIVGHNIDHLILIGLFLLFIILKSGGVIL
jgi:hypothetical protein